jgi:hypothetical protein
MVDVRERTNGRWVRENGTGERMDGGQVSITARGGGESRSCKEISWDVGYSAVEARRSHQ